MSDYLELTEADDGKLFRIRIDNTGEERIARYPRFTIAGRPLTYPCFADPDYPDDDRRWLHSGWGAVAAGRVRSE